jgi:hypothetical protein
MKPDTIAGIALVGVFLYMTTKRRSEFSSPVDVPSHYTTPNKPRPSPRTSVAVGEPAPGKNPVQETIARIEASGTKGTDTSGRVTIGGERAVLA